MLFSKFIAKLVFRWGMCNRVAYFSLRMRETPIFLLPVKNLTSALCSPTPISYKMQEFCDSAINMGQIAYFSLRMCETPIFLLPVKNLTSLSCSPTPISYNTREFWHTWTFKADIAFFIFAWTQTDFIICPMLYAIAMGQIKSIQQTAAVLSYAVCTVVCTYFMQQRWWC